MVVFNPIQTNAMPLCDKLKNMLWQIVNRLFFRFSPRYFSLFNKWRILLVKLFGGQLDWNVSLHPTAYIDYPWNLTMRAKSSLGERCWIYAMAPISIGELTCIGKDVYLLTGSHDIEKSTFDLITKSIIIGKGCWLATASIVLPGITIGNYSVIAVGSIVTKDVECNTVVGGNPAKFIKQRVIKE